MPPTSSTARSSWSSPASRSSYLRARTRAGPLADRVEAFAKRYTDRVRVLDAAAVELPGISHEVRSLISPVLLATLLERVSAHLEVLRDHPLTTRRYYKRVDY